MFKAMLRYRLTELWSTVLKTLLGVFMTVVVAAIIAVGVSLYQHVVFSWIEYVKFIAYAMVFGGLIASQIVIMIAAFTSVRPFFEFGIQNGISRQTSYATQLVTLFSTQTITFLIGYLLAVWMNYNASLAFLLAPRVVIMVILVGWLLLASALQISSFMTLFEKKMWWVIFVIYIAWSVVYNQYLAPILTSILPAWAKALSFDVVVIFGDTQSADSILHASQQPLVWLSSIVSLLIPLIIAGVCQHFMQTRRLAFTLRKD